MQRVLLFLGTNIAVLAVISVLMKIFGLDNYMDANGINYKTLAIISFLWGSVGAFISLAMSKSAAKRSMGVRIIESPSTDDEMWLVDTVRRQAERVGIGMPEVGIFNSDSPNAFATGMNKNDALVAVSTGLLRHMRRNEIEAVLAHEISHISNGDMVTMTLLQGILNAFVMFISRIIGFVMSSSSRSNRGNMGMRAGNFIGTMIAQVVLGFLAAIIIKWFSRYREFHADAGAGRLTSNQDMIAALRALQHASNPQSLKGSLVGFGINGVTSSVAKLFSTHPPLEDRIAALEQNSYAR